MKVFIVKYDVPYEFGELLGVYQSRAGAEAARLIFANPPEETYTREDGSTYTFAYDRDLDNLSIEEWDVQP